MAASVASAMQICMLMKLRAKRCAVSVCASSGQVLPELRQNILQNPCHKFTHAVKVFVGNDRGYLAMKT